MMNLQKSSVVTATSIAALAPVILGSIASYCLTFRCCDGIAFSPVPWLGYLRWDISLAIWCGLAVLMTLVALLATLLTKVVPKHKQNSSSSSSSRSVGVVAVVYAILIQQVSTRWAALAGRLLIAPQYGWEDQVTTKHDVPWVDEDKESEFREESLPHVQTSDEPVLSPKQCEEFVSYALSYADDWMHSYEAIPPTAYVVFGGDANYGGEEEFEFEPFRPWHSRAPWLSDILPSWNYFYGFERYVGRVSESNHLNQTHVRHVQEAYTFGLRPYLEKVRRGLARHMGTTSEQIVMGGDEGTVLHDFAPPSVIVQLPNHVREFYNNYHTDTITWETSIIFDRLEEQSGEKPCLGGDHVYGGTLLLETPKDGAGMLWWLADVENEGKGFQFYTPYRLGYLATVPDSVPHTIAPSKYGGWMDKKRITLQMFLLQCIGEDSTPTWYVFH